MKLQKTVISKLLSICSNVNAAPLCEAAGSGYLDIVKYFVGRGADVNAKTGYGFIYATPLMRASESGHLDIVKYLVENGADVNFKTSRHAIFATGKEANINDDSSFTALYKAIENGHSDIVKYLVENGANIDAVEHRALSIAKQKLSTQKSLPLTVRFTSAQKKKYQEIIEYLESKKVNQTNAIPSTENKRIAPSVRR